jgi:hypothetical protein
MKPRRRRTLFGVLLTLLFTSVQSARVIRAQALPADTPRITTEGATFIAPAGWSIEVRGPATILTPPEADSHIALIDVRAADADAAVAAAWAAYRPDPNGPSK